MHINCKHTNFIECKPRILYSFVKNNQPVEQFLGIRDLFDTKATHNRK